jgi:hypothetical protein
LVQYILEELPNKLETVITKFKIQELKRIPISYNFKTIVDGNENKIEDVIKKLPGLNEQVAVTHSNKKLTIF